jgi:hypothetical protein
MKKAVVGFVVAVFLVGIYAIGSFGLEVRQVYRNAKQFGLTENEKKNFKTIELWFAQRLDEQRQAAERAKQRPPAAPPAQPSAPVSPAVPVEK